jgi:hypothetical protein
MADTVSGRTLSDLITGKPEPVNPYVGGARAAIGQGLGMGWGDEAEAWLRSKLTNQPYDETLKRIRQEYGEYAKQYPVQQAGFELAGGLLPMAASYFATPATGGAAAPAAAATTARTAGALSRLATNPYVQGALFGAGTGAISGAGSAEEGGRLAGAGTGAAIGTGIGAVTPAAIRGGSGAFNWLRERVAPTEAMIANKAVGKMAEGVASSGMVPADIASKLAQDKALNVPSMVMNTGEGLADLGEAVAQRSGKSARTMEQNLREQKAGSRERVYQQTKEGLGAGNYYNDEDRMVSELRKKADTLYDKAYEIGSINDPRINAVLEDPHFAAFYDKAKSIAEKEALAAKLAGEDPSKYQLKEIYKFKTAPDGTITGIEKVDVPDVRTLDYIKRGIDATIEAGYKSGSGISKAETNALKDLRKQYINALDEATIPSGGGESPYKAARQAYAGDMEVLDAMRTGMNDFNKMDHEEIIKLVKGMGDAEKDAFRTGVVRNLYSKIMDPATNFNSAQRIIGSPETQAKLQPLFESPEKFNLFKAAMEREAQLYHEANKVLGGSQTAKRTQMRENLESDSGVGDAVASAVTGGWWNSLTGIAARAARNANVTDETAERLAKMLTAKDPQEVAAVVKTLEDYSAQSAKNLKQLGTAEIGASTGITTAIPPAPSAPSSEGADIEADITNKAPAFGPDIEADIAARRK